MLTWSRPKTQETLLSRWRIHQAKDAPYRVVHVVSKFGLPPRFVAMAGPLRILSGHRTLGAAQRACERKAKEQRRTLCKSR